MLNDSYDKHFNCGYENVPIHSILHRHNKCEFVIVEKGESTIIMSDTVKLLHAPFFVYYPPYVLHEQINSTDHPYSRYFIQFDINILDNTALIPNNFVAIELKESEIGLFRDIAELIVKYCDNPQSSDNNRLRLKYLLLLFLNDLSPIVARHMPELTVPNKYNYINEVCKYIRENCGERLSLDNISEHFFISRAKLTHDFKYVNSMTVTEYISTVRISNSKLLLKDGLSLEEIAERCGFSSSSYYITTFKSITGMTPAQFRVKIKSKPFGNV